MTNKPRLILDLEQYIGRELEERDAAEIGVGDEEFGYKPGYALKAGKVAALSLWRLRIKELQFLANYPHLEILNLGGIGIKDLGPLASLQLLTKLYLYNNQIVDLEPLAFLIKLTKLYLYHNHIADLGPLASLQLLSSLRLENNQISDLGPLASLQQLSFLGLDSNQIADLRPLASLQQLSSLYLNNNQIADLAPLASHLQLSSLGIENNQISELEPLASLQQLSTLFLQNNKIADLGPLASLQQLSTLFLQNNLISDLEPLAYLKKLSSLNLESNQIAVLKKAIRHWPPYCKINLAGNQLPFPDEILNGQKVAIIQALAKAFSDDSSEQTNILRVPKPLRTALRQYLIYFNHFVESVKGEEVAYDVRQHPDGLELVIVEEDDERLAQFQEWFGEFLGYVSQSVDEIKPHFETEMDDHQRTLETISLKHQLQSLKQQLEFRDFQIRVLQDREHKSDRLLELAVGNNEITLNLNSTASADANAKSIVKVRVDLKMELPAMRDAVAELRDIAPSDQLKEIEDKLDALPPDAEEAALQESGVMRKLERWLKKAHEGESKVASAIETAKKGKEHLSMLVNAYNKTAEALGFNPLQFM